MSLGLLSPAALALLGLVLGPILVHLARQRPARQVPYGAMLLLRRLSRKQRRRRRLQDPLLLLLRLLAVAAVALAITRPELRWPGAPPTVGGTGAVVVVLDDSLSMDLEQGGLAGVDPSDGAGTLFSVARQQAVDLVRALPEGTLVGAVTIGGAAQRLTPRLSTDRAGVAAALEEVRQGQGGTDLAGGIQQARRLLSGAGGEVVVFSDEAGPDTVTAARDEIALLGQQGGALVPRPIHAAQPTNLSVVDARYGDGPEGGSVCLRVANFGPSQVEAPVTVSLPDGTEITAFVTVPAGGTAEQVVTVPRVAAGGVGLARVQDEALPADNAFAFQLPRVGASRVLVVDGDPGPTPTASEVYFLERALAPWGATAAARGGVLPDVTSAAGLEDLDPKVHRVVFLANVADPMPLAGRLLDFVRSGGGVVISLGSNVTADRYNAALSGILPSPLRKARPLADIDASGPRVELPDTSLALFQPFARGGRAAFHHIAVSQLFTLDPYHEGGGVRTLLRLEDGNPLLVERDVGQGRVLLLTTTIDLGWTDLPLQAIFMPLVQRLTSYLGGEAGGGGERRSVQVGDSVSLSLPASILDLSVTGPAGAVPVQVRSGTATFRADLAGAYVVEAPGAPPLAWVAANTDPRESDVRPGPSLVQTAAEVDPDRFLRHVPLTPWLLGAGLLLALIQAALAGPRKGEDEDAATGAATGDEPPGGPAEALDPLEAAHAP